MREQYIKFVDEDVDGCGTDIISIAKNRTMFYNEEK